MKTTLFAAVGAANMILQDAVDARRAWHPTGTTVKFESCSGMPHHKCVEPTLQLTFQFGDRAPDEWLFGEQDILINANGKACIEDVDGTPTTVTFLKTRAVTAADLPALAAA